MRQSLINRSGFTLIELVIVILLLGILAAFAVPKWLGKGGFETQTIRDELISRLRLVQTINMQAPPSQCTRLALEGNRFAHRSQQLSASGLCPAAGAINGWSANTLAKGHLVVASADIRISLNTATTFSLRFDAMGRPLEACATGCTLQVSSGQESSLIRIESQGYIHALP